MRENLTRLRELGVEPYPPRSERTHTAREIADGFDVLEGKSVTVAGRLMAVRGHGKAGFADLVDGTGKTQLYVKADVAGPGLFEVWKLLDVGDIVGARGEVFKTRSGEVSVKVEVLTLLAKALRPLPEKWHGLKDKELRYRQRYLDLIANEDSRRVFEVRSAMLRIAREFLHERDFLEVETPVLQPIYGGAFAQPFVTQHHALDMTLYLRIADELYLKRLIVGGFERVFEIGKDFRNEGMDRTHSPEFTQLELYQAYADYHDMMEITESMVVRMAEHVVGDTRVPWQEGEIDLRRPWKRLRVMDALAGVVGRDAVTDAASLAAAARKEGIDVADGASWGDIIEQVLSERVEPDLMEPTFLIDYPKSVSPLAKQTPENPEIVERFEVFAGGLELGNSFTELNDPDEQRRRLEDQVEEREKGDDEAHGMDEDFVRALEHGMPPTGGLGIGLDRLVMLLTNSWNIRDVILFPPMRPES
ncbi:MAG: lysine--tRNA ligase [Candidatus Eisenbacteria bacterium]|nr:lysine--tRNA ligase [Candidatus Eisenbacteria bacterium]